MKTEKIFISFLIFIVFSTQIFSQKIISDSSNQAELETILKKCAEYCEKLSNSVLDFVCIENINENFFYNYRKGHYFINQLIETDAKNTYSYDYQLIRKDKKIREQRMLLEVNGKEIKHKKAPLITQRFSHERVIFGPTGLLSQYWQQYFNYRITGEEIWNGINVIIIEATPNDPDKVEHLYGKIWVDKNDYSILKIDWNPKSLGNFFNVLVLAKKFRTKPIITFSSEYGFGQKGIRFPSKYSIKEEYILNNNRLIDVLFPKGLKKTNRFTMSETVVTYEDYKFFTVEYEVKYENSLIKKELKH